MRNNLTMMIKHAHFFLSALRCCARYSAQALGVRGALAAVSYTARPVSRGLSTDECRQSLCEVNTKSIRRPVKRQQSNVAEAEGTPDFSLRDMVIYCNEERWHEYQQSIRIDTTFVDTHYNAPVSQQDTVPTILGIHDTPGSYEDMLPILAPFAMKGYRVVIPNMPGNNETFVKAKKERPFFTHSTEERTEFLVNFLSELKLFSIHLAVGHGAGTGPISMLMSSNDVFKSALLICPTPGHQIHASFSDLYKVNWILKFHDRPLFKPLTSVLMKELCRQSNMKVPLRKVEHVVRGICGYGYEYLPGLVRSTSYKKNPVTYVLATEDEIHSAELSLEYAELYGVKTDKFVVYNEENPENPDYLLSKPRQYLKSGVELKSCGHNPQLNDYYREVLITEASRLLKEVIR